MKNCLLLLVLSIAFQSLIAQKIDDDSSWRTIYRASAPRINDLVHTKLEVRFDYDKSYMYGKAWITIQPHFYPTDSLALDAKGMEIKKVEMMSGSRTTPLKYSYDGMVLNIKLGKTYKGDEKYTIYIDYTAKPDELKTEGSAAITDAKGLYFINPKGEDKNKPTQIWTQGETEANSVWMPTIDKPNQKSTEDIYMTVPKKYVTLSNGELVSQKENADGTRTDYWRMDLPHAPYLFFMGVGDYAIIKDSYKGKQVNYYVEPAYASVAKRIFGNTPEMMAFYARITGVEFPWIKYSQIVGRDYVSGAMENTTATLHQESAQQDARQLVDGNGWENDISHELFHQWFGDLVTCESWSNLTLNESFANYSETLWNEYKYGKDAGDETNYNDMQGYLNSGKGDLPLIGTPDSAKDLVRFYYHDKEDMFDVVSYNKGGRILNMLRNYVGDSAFFKALNLYLITNKFKAAEAHQLRLAFEEVTGKDMNWFFNQWYFGAGHPELTIDYTYDAAAKQVRMTVKQTQQGTPFILPVAVDIYNSGKKVRHTIWIKNREEMFAFDCETNPDLVNFDGDKMLLCTKTENKTLQNYIYQYTHAGNYVDRKEAIDACAEKQNDPAALALLKLAIKDKYFGLRKYAISKLDMTNDLVKKEVESLLEEIATHDKKSVVRAAALELMGNYKNYDWKSLFLTAVRDSSYSVAGAALTDLAGLDKTVALEEVRKIEHEPAKGTLATAISGILIANGTEEDFDLIADNFGNLPMGEAKLEALEPFAVYLIKVNDTEKFKKGIDLIVATRDAIPQAYRAQIVPSINTGILQGIITQKMNALGGANGAAIQVQIDYVKSKL